MSRTTVFSSKLLCGAILATLIATDACAQLENPTGFVVAATIGRSRIQDQDGPGDSFDGGDQEEGMLTTLGFRWQY